MKQRMALTLGTGNTGWTNVWRYGDKTNYHMTNLGGTFRTLDNVDGRCELEQGILSKVSVLSHLIQCRIGVKIVVETRSSHGMGNWFLLVAQGGQGLSSVGLG
jgi:hypothetical protein